MEKRQFDCLVAELKAIAVKTINDCTFVKDASYFQVEAKMPVLLPSGDEKYRSLWVRDAAMMAESKLVPSEELKRYIEIFAVHGQNGGETRYLENGLTVPPYAIADHVNYDGKPVFFPGTYASGNNQGSGLYGFFPPFCDNYYFIMMVEYYINQSGDRAILDTGYNGISLSKRMEYAFQGYNIDNDSGLCVSDSDVYTVDWGFVDTIKKSGQLLMSSLLRYNAALTLVRLINHRYQTEADKIKSSILDAFWDNRTGWFYSATGIGHQYDVWATAYAVYSGVTDDTRVLKALYDAYKDRTAVVDGYVRHILNDHDFSASSAWESTVTPYGEYQNGAYWATPTGWYAYALYKYNGTIDILDDFLKHTERYADKGSPFEWIDETTEKVSGLNYGTSGVLPYIGAKRIAENK